MAPMARAGGLQAGVGARRAHAVEGDLLALRHGAGDCASAVAIRIERDCVEAERAKGAGEEVERVCDCSGRRTLIDWRGVMYGFHVRFWGSLKRRDLIALLEGAPIDVMLDGLGNPERKDR